MLSKISKTFQAAKISGAGFKPIFYYPARSFSSGYGNSGKDAAENSYESKSKRDFSDEEKQDLSQNQNKSSTATDDADVAESAGKYQTLISEDQNINRNVQNKNRDKNLSESNTAADATDDVDIAESAGRTQGFKSINQKPFHRFSQSKVQSSNREATIENKERAEEMIDEQVRTDLNTDEALVNPQKLAGAKLDTDWGQYSSTNTVTTEGLGSKFGQNRVVGPDSTWGRVANITSSARPDSQDAKSIRSRQNQEDQNKASRQQESQSSGKKNKNK